MNYHADPSKDRNGAMSLTDRARMRGASRMIPDGTDAADVTPDQILQVAADVEQFKIKHGIKRSQIVRATGYSEGVISDFLNGKYKGNAGQVAIDLDAWIDEEDKRLSRPSTTQFVWTNIAREIESVAHFAIDYRKISMIYGEDTSGFGKTTAMTAIANNLGARRATMITIDRAMGNATGLTRVLCTAFGLNHGGGNDDRFCRLVDHLKGRSHLLLIDQIHNLCHCKDDKPFYYLTDLYDATKTTAQLWCSTTDLLSYFKRQQKSNADGSLTQIRSRISPYVDLATVFAEDHGGDGGELLVNVEQVRDMFSRNKLRLTAPASRFLCVLANLPDHGGLRACVQLVEYVTAVAESRKWNSIDIPQLKTALRHVLPDERAQTRLHDINELAERLGLKVAAG